MGHQTIVLPTNVFVTPNDTVRTAVFVYLSKLSVQSMLHVDISFVTLAQNNTVSKDNQMKAILSFYGQRLP